MRDEVAEKLQELLRGEYGWRDLNVEVGYLMTPVYIRCSDRGGGWERQLNGNCVHN